jgi:hypothetical protein
MSDFLMLLLLLGLAGVCFGAPFGLGKLSMMDQELRLMVLGKEAGRVALVDFTLRCGVHVAVARWFLAAKARQLNAIQEVDEGGDVVFLFREAKRKYLAQVD